MLQALIQLESLRAELRRRLEMIRRQRPFPGRSIGTFGGPARAPAIPIEEDVTMNTEAHDTPAENAITKSDIELARIDLDSKCDAIFAICNAIAVLTKAPSVPEGLYGNTIHLLAVHIASLAGIMQNDIGLFIEKVEEAQ